MTYNLEEFKAWIERNPSIQLPHWFEGLITNNEIFFHLVESKRYQSCHFDNPNYGSWTTRQEVFSRWLTEKTEWYRKVKAKLQKYQSLIQQRKSTLQAEIQLIKEVLND